MCTFTDDGNTAMAIKWYQKQHDADGTAASPHRAHLSVLPASTSAGWQGCTLTVRHLPLQLSILPLAWSCYHSNHCLHKAKHETWSIFLPGRVGHIHVIYCQIQICPKCPIEERKAESGPREETTGVGLFLFWLSLSLFPSFFPHWGFNFCVGIRFGFQPGSLS